MISNYRDGKRASDWPMAVVTESVNDSKKFLVVNIVVYLSGREFSGEEGNRV